MFVKMGPYERWVNIYRWKWVHKLEERFGEDRVEWWMERTLEPIIGLWNRCRASERKIEVRIDPWDIWGMDTSLAHIIHPMLVLLKEKKQGAPDVDDEDVPEHLRCNPGERERYNSDGTTDDKFFQRWDWVIDEMIWAMDEIRNDHPGEKKFFRPHSKAIDGWLFDKGEFPKIDLEGLTAYRARVNNGTRLFGKFFQALWD